MASVGFGASLMFDFSSAFFDTAVQWCHSGRQWSSQYFCLQSRQVNGRKVFIWQYSSEQWAPISSRSLVLFMLLRALAIASSSLLDVDEDAMVERLGGYM